MNIYENIIIFNASLSDEEIDTTSGKVKDLIVNSGGEIFKADIWGRKKLAYDIQKQKKGFFILLLFKAPSATIKKLEDYYKVTDTVIKYMVLKLGKKQADKALQAATAEAATATAEEKPEIKSEV
ncbi:MAG: 30S ribosomal protein S6 [Nitrospiraceae bacterium]|nr:30S ribosomal protein S6 [Nitrospiraceae bacterium]